MRPEFIAMLNDAGGPRWSYGSRAGLLTFVWKKKEKKETNETWNARESATSPSARLPVCPSVRRVRRTRPVVLLNALERKKKNAEMY